MNHCFNFYNMIPGRDRILTTACFNNSVIHVTFCASVLHSVEEIWTVQVGCVFVHLRQDISRAQFCLAPTGAGWGIRVVEEVTRGCIPVIIQDNVTQAFEEILPYAKFSVRVSEADIPRLPEILRNITQVQSSHHSQTLVLWLLMVVTWRMFECMCVYVHSKLDQTRILLCMVVDAMWFNVILFSPYHQVIFLMKNYGCSRKKLIWMFCNIDFDSCLMNSDIEDSFCQESEHIRD